MSDKIIILHGIVRTHRSMRGLATYLEHAGYKVLNVGYPSTKHKIEGLADIIHPKISRFISGGEGKVHFVGYSMGGLLTRAYLKKYRPENMGRVVMVGTPNYGSEVADFLKDFFLYKKLYGPAGQQLVTSQEEFRHIFCEVDFELGIIAGNRSLDPISSRIIGKPNDGKVSIESAVMKGAKEHIIIPSTHTFFPSNRKMWEQTLAFIKDGSFNR